MSTSSRHPDNVIKFTNIHRKLQNNSKRNSFQPLHSPEHVHGVVQLVQHALIKRAVGGAALRPSLAVAIGLVLRPQTVNGQVRLHVIAGAIATRELLLVAELGAPGLLENVEIEISGSSNGATATYWSVHGQVSRSACARHFTYSNDACKAWKRCFLRKQSPGKQSEGRK